MATRRNLHLRGLQAAHSKVLEIIEDAPHVAIYRFSPEERKWSRMDIEGSAYVTRNSESPFYSLIVLNKKGSEDLILQIIPHIQKILLQDQYVMMKCLNESGEIILGVWIHDDSERQRMYDCISRIVTNGTSTGQSSNMNNLLSKLATVKIAMDEAKNGNSGLQQEASSSTAIPAAAPTPSINLSSKLLSVLKKPATDNSVNAALPSVPDKASGSPTSTTSSISTSPPLVPLNTATSPQPVSDPGNGGNNGISSAMKSQKLLSILKSPVVNGGISGTAAAATTPSAPVAAVTFEQPSVTSSSSKINTNANNKASQLLSLLNSKAASAPAVSAVAVPPSAAVAASSNGSDLLTDGDIAKSLNKAKQMLVLTGSTATTQKNGNGNASLDSLIADPPKPSMMPMMNKVEEKPKMTTVLPPPATATAAVNARLRGNTNDPSLDIFAATAAIKSSAAAATTNNVPTTAAISVSANNNLLATSSTKTNNTKVLMNSPVSTSMSNGISLNVSPNATMSTPISSNGSGSKINNNPLTASTKKPVMLISPSDLENM